MKIIIYIILILSVVIITYTLFNTGPDTGNYEMEIIRHRKEVDDFMRTDPSSPFNQDSEVRFRGLNYYKVDDAYKVEAGVTINHNPEKISLRMSDGTTSDYLTFARLDFTIKEESQALTLLKPVDVRENNIFFLPFYDETSARETYGGGRYLDLEYDNQKNITIDFNRAYNPYCAYTGKYTCPLPPKENQITVAVEAGEKNYKPQD